MWLFFAPMLTNAVKALRPFRFGKATERMLSSDLWESV
jgi:hypothetical protein